MPLCDPVPRLTSDAFLLFENNERAFLLLTSNARAPRPSTVLREYARGIVGRAPRDRAWSSLTAAPRMRNDQCDAPPTPAVCDALAHAAGEIMQTAHPSLEQAQPEARQVYRLPQRRHLRKESQAHARNGASGAGARPRSNFVCEIVSQAPMFSRTTASSYGRKVHQFNVLVLERKSLSDCPRQHGNRRDLLWRMTAFSRRHYHRRISFRGLYGRPYRCNRC